MAFSTIHTANHSEIHFSSLNPEKVAIFEKTFENITMENLRDNDIDFEKLGFVNRRHLINFFGCAGDFRAVVREFYKANEHYQDHGYDPIYTADQTGWIFNHVK